MIRTLATLIPEAKHNVRGGVGAAASVTYLQKGDMDGVVTMGRTVLEPGSSIGEHLHPDTEEIWLILEGHGTVLLTDSRPPRAPAICSSPRPVTPTACATARTAP